ncbi:VCBS repeat-containing protein [Sorangium sp. So ce321]|uniref:FG-GAP repeat domain-containing protein n=1 Tax=Sorangium sp. So ce321 TaxID=3133300 RepID=UPI003F648B8F
MGDYQRGFPIDYNQDGKTDLLLADLSPTWRVLESTGIGFRLQDTGIPRSPRSLFFYDLAGVYDYLTAGIYLVDLNGDGIKDLFEFDFWPNDPERCFPFAPEVCGGQWGYRLHDGHGFGPRVTIPELDGTTIAMPVVPLDVDGDGAQEILLFRCTAYAYKSCETVESGEYQILRWRKQPHSGDGLITLTSSGISDPSQDYREALVPVDVNGDGLKDIVASKTYGDDADYSLSLWINHGGSFVHHGIATTSEFMALERNLQASLVLDYDGDGREDLLIPYEHDWPFDDKFAKLFLLRAAPSGRAFLVEDPGLPYEPAPDEQTNESWPSRQGPRMADVDGDGLHDLVTVHQGKFRVRLHRAPYGGRPDAVVSIRDGGNDFDHDTIGHTPGGAAPPTVAIHYAPLIRSYSPSMTLEHGTDPDALYLLRAGAGALCSYPCKRFVGPKYVVAQHLEDVSTEPGSPTGATNRRLTAHSYGRVRRPTRPRVARLSRARSPYDSHRRLQRLCRRVSCQQERRLDPDGLRPDDLRCGDAELSVRGAADLDAHLRA